MWGNKKPPKHRIFFEKKQALAWFLLGFAEFLV